MSKSSRSEIRWPAHRLGFVLGAVFYLLLATYLVLGRLASPVVTVPGYQESRVQQILPQGWMFFTKSPRSSAVMVYVRDDKGNWIAVNSVRISDSKSFLHLDRSVRALGVEMALLAHSVPQADWRSGCRESDRACLEGAPMSVSVKNIVPHPVMCGEVGLVSRAPIPWAWARAGAGVKFRAAAAAARLRVQC